MSIENYGSYQLVRRIALGGMAEIHLARRAGSDRLLVVKRILPHLAVNAEFIRMFLDEARIAARVHHPNVVQIFDLGAAGGTYFIAMEHIHGEDVRRIWKRAANRGMTIPPPLVCRILADACAGLDAAHRLTDDRGRPLGIVHRDVSPQNLLVAFDGRVKVADFGIAKAADQATVTKSGVLKGKYSYMSPEQASGQPVDARSDLFALGIVLHELLTGTRLFKRVNDLQTLHAVAECRVHPPSRDNPNLPPELDAIVLRALEKAPGDRYADAGALRAALEGWLQASGAPATQADVAAFLRELYAEEEDPAAAVSRPGQEPAPVDAAGAFVQAAPGAAAAKNAAATGPAAPRRNLATGRSATVGAASAGPAPEPIVPELRRRPQAAPATSPEISVSERMTELVARVQRSPELTQPAPFAEDPPTEAMSFPQPAVFRGATVAPAQPGLEARPPAAQAAPARRARRLRVAAISACGAALGLGGWQAVASLAPGTPEPTGTVQFDVTPWGEISCDGRVLGRTPLPDRALPVGTHACEVTHPSLGTVRRQVDVKANTVEKVSIHLEDSP